MLKASASIEVPFNDVDSYAIVWHGNYPKYFELARSALLNAIGYSYKEMDESGFVFPVVDMQIRYVKPIQLRQQIIVHATLKEWQHWIKVQYNIVDAKTEERLTKGYTRQVAMKAGGTTLLDESPAILIDKVASALHTQAALATDSSVKPSASKAPT